MTTAFQDFVVVLFEAITTSNGTRTYDIVLLDDFESSQESPHSLSSRFPGLQGELLHVRRCERRGLDPHETKDLEVGPPQPRGLFLKPSCLHRRCGKSAQVFCAAKQIRAIP